MLNSRRRQRKSRFRSADTSSRRRNRRNRGRSTNRRPKKSRNVKPVSASIHTTGITKPNTTKNAVNGPEITARSGATSIKIYIKAGKDRKSKSKPQTLKFSPFSGFFFVIKILHIFIKNILTSYK